VNVPSIVHDRQLGTLSVFVAAELRWLYEGFVAAIARFQAEADARREASATFRPLFEALNWAVSIEEYMRVVRNEPLTDDLVHAFGYARNRVHHQWQHALEPVETEAPAGLGVFEGGELADVFVEWYWKPLDALRRGRADKRGECAYPLKLAGRPVRETLRELQDVFDRSGVSA
jgi:hypothetical protein